MPAFFYAGIPQKGDKSDSYPKLLKILLLYIVFTLLTAYSLVLYIYFIKILFEFTLPSNLLGNLVIHYLLISIAALYFALPIESENKWSNLIFKIYPYILIPSVIMIIISFIVRINAYGITEARYYALVCAVFVILSIATIIKMRHHAKLIPLTFSILLLIATFSPISSFNISKLSQNLRLERILTQNGMLDSGKLLPKDNLDNKTMTEISDIINYFDNNHKLSDIKLVPSDFTLNDMENTFGFSLYYGYESANNLAIYTNFDKYSILDVDNYSYMIELYSGKNNREFNKSIGTINIDTDNNNHLTISLEQKQLYKVDMLKLMKPYLKKSTSPHIKLLDVVKKDLPSVIIKDNNDTISIKLIVDYAYYSIEEIQLDYHIYLLFNIK
jgi:hypothetical protein